MINATKFMRIAETTFTTEQARALAEAIEESSRDEVATKTDIAELRVEMHSLFREQSNRIITWMFIQAGLVITSVGLIVRFL